MSEKWLARAVLLASVPKYDGRSVRAVFDGAGEQAANKKKRQATVEEVQSLLAGARLT